MKNANVITKTIKSQGAISLCSVLTPRQSNTVETLNFMTFLFGGKEQRISCFNAFIFTSHRPGTQLPRKSI